MSRETKCQAIVLKKQPLGEGDEIITFFSKELGKIRCLAKSVKSSKSKLQQKLQGLFLVNLSFTHGKLPKIISAEPVKVFSTMRENLESLKRAFYAQELVLKFTADEQKNEPLFFLFESFLGYLDSSANEEVLDLGLLKFKMDILQTLGLGVHDEAASDNQQGVFFSPVSGGFNRRASADSLKVSSDVYGLFLDLRDVDFNHLQKIQHKSGEKELQNLLSQFIEYQLERKVRSEKFLRSASS
jgi:DNA repair protein RecO (recombination protein O)